MQQKLSKNDPYKYLNNLTFTKQSIEQIMHYIKTQELPPDLDNRQKRKFIARFSSHWNVEGDELYFTPLELLAVSEDEIDKVIESVYEDPVKSLGKGINAFYDEIRTHFVGITRNDVTQYLRNQEKYQVTFVKKKTQQRPIFATYPNEKWGADLVDMNQYISQNKQYRYILTVIDYFSRKVFACALKTKDLKSTIAGFESIIREQTHNTHPQILITDNGSEFELGDWCKSHKIHLQHTQSHSPTQNALVENFNGTLRRLIRANFVRREDLNWVEDLQLLLENYNNKKHNTLKQIPNDLWNEGKARVRTVAEDDTLKVLSKEEKQSKVLVSTLGRVEKQLERLKKQELNVGDIVRVRTEILHSAVRKNIKSGLGKNVVVKFSTKLYKISKVIKSRSSFSLNKYLVVDMKGNELLEEFNMKKPNAELKPLRLSNTDLLRVDGNTKTVLNKKIESKLNKTINDDVDNVDDVEEVEEETEIVPKRAARTRKQRDILDL